MQNQYRHLLLMAIVLLGTAAGVAKPALAQISSLSFKGFNYVSYYNGAYENADSLPALVGAGANAAALAFEYGIDVQNSTVYADSNYTDSLAAIAATITEANSRGLSVMVRPLIDFLDPAVIGSYSMGEWRSLYNPTNAAAFFASYKTMIVAVAQVAQSNGAASLCIGAELDQLTGPAYLSYWTDIITSVRAVFSGKLTYSAEWSDDISPWQGQNGLNAGTGSLATQVSFWNQLDYLGIDVYAPISDAANPDLAQLIAGWTLPPSDPTSLSVTGNQSLISYFSSLATQTGKLLVFTEIGYESASDAAQQPAYSSTNIYDPTLQANLYSAFFAAWQQSGDNSLTGVYFWNWDPNAAEVGPGNGPNFSPQAEPAQTVVTANFSAFSPPFAVAPATSIASSGNQGGPFSPSSFHYQLTAPTGSLGYSISGTPGWLTASSTSGALSTSATTITFAINSSANNLSPATYQATITFTDTTNNSTVWTTPAALTVLNPPIAYTLGAVVSGSGAVTSAPAGVSCPSTCSASFSSGEQVTLTATPASGWSFSGWGGACSGAGACLVTMNSAQSVSATFSQVDYTLSVSVIGDGAVTSAPSGVSCPSTCSASFGSGAQVTLTAAPASGGSFSGWGGACSGTSPCKVTMSAAESVSATFATGNSQTSRTWVSGTGSDNPSCTIAAPCQTFAQAYAATAPGGEIDCLTAGGFGALTITQSISIVCATSLAGVLASSGDGIDVNVAAGNRVVLDGLDFEGAGSGANGVSMTGFGQLVIRNSTIRDFAGFGIYMAGPSATPSPRLLLQNLRITNNAGGGVDVSSSSANNVEILNTLIDSNANFNLEIVGPSTVVLSASTLSGTNPNSIVSGGGALISYRNNVLGNLGAPTSTMPLQ